MLSTISTSVGKHVVRTCQDAETAFHPWSTGSLKIPASTHAMPSPHDLFLSHGELITICSCTSREPDG